MEFYAHVSVNPVSWQSGPNQRVMTGAVLLMHSALFHGPSGVCGFEDSLCGLEHSRQETFHWTRSAGTTPTDNTGPSYDHTTFTEEGGPHWMWFCLQRYAAACDSQLLWEQIAHDLPFSILLLITKMTPNTVQWTSSLSLVVPFAV